MIWQNGLVGLENESRKRYVEPREDAKSIGKKVTTERCAQYQRVDICTGSHDHRGTTWGTCTHLNGSAQTPRSSLIRFLTLKVSYLMQGNQRLWSGKPLNRRTANRPGRYLQGFGCSSLVQHPRLLVVIIYSSGFTIIFVSLYDNAVGFSSLGPIPAVVFPGK